MDLVVTMTSFNTKTIEVPEYMIEDLQKYIEMSLKIGGQPAIKMEIQENKDRKTNYVEVTDVIDHKIKHSGEWCFKLQFKDYSTEWVDDSDTNCEELISNYLLGIGIKTAHCICRVSSKMQSTRDCVSLEAQEEEIVSHVIKTGNFQRIKIHKYVSSVYKKIPKLLRKIADSTKGGSSLFFWRADRCGRNIGVFSPFLDELDKRGVGIFSVSEGIEYSKNPMAFAQGILDAQKESHALGKRIRLSYDMRRARGDTRVGRLPYGKKYQTVVLDGSIRKIVINDDVEKSIIKDIRQSREHPRILASNLNDSGILKRGKKWNAGMITRIRKNCAV